MSEQKVACHGNHIKIPMLILAADIFPNLKPQLFECALNLGDLMWA
jgi:hypothetical protein